ncbi:hypothetical protein DFR67_114162 [Williamsia limnetica]|uniref:Uncharacterized protein n=1 Tax=Williamsia limnetica TaxID=882452 RepID=A0A318RQH3_WILLI|nr:hypothetical protein [Williamsia limnetica]PYE14063.1 hypothetical protein DFR67_114162 [Williamsia limnetica]
MSEPLMVSDPLASIVTVFAVASVLVNSKIMPALPDAAGRVMMKDAVVASHSLFVAETVVRVTVAFRTIPSARWLPVSEWTPVKAAVPDVLIG